MPNTPNLLSNYAPYGLDMDLFRTMYPQFFQQYQEFQQRQQPQAVLGGGRPFFWGLPQVTVPNQQTAQPIIGQGTGFTEEDFNPTPVNPVNDPPLTPPVAPAPVVPAPPAKKSSGGGRYYGAGQPGVTEGFHGYANDILDKWFDKPSYHRYLPSPLQRQYRIGNYATD